MSNRTSTHTADINRRQFLAAGSGLSFSLAMGAAIGPMGALAQTNDSRISINAWVNIATDNTITIFAPTAEMGQGTLTTLPLILAEELDADWSKVKVEIAPPNPKIYGNPHPLLNGGQAALASVAVPGYFKPLRVAGAQARRVLMDAVATKWSVPISELSTQNSTVVHAKSNQRISYGDVAKFASVPAELPKISDDDLKKPEQFTLIGRTHIGRIDVQSKVDGTAQFGIDAKVEGMVYAAVLESPMEGAKAENVNTDEVLAIPGVQRVLTLPFGVAVIGKTG